MDNINEILNNMSAEDYVYLKRILGYEAEINDGKVIKAQGIEDRLMREAA